MNNKKFDVQLFIPYRFNILAKRMGQALSEIYTREFDITIAEWRTLLWIHSNDKVYAKDICYHCVMDKTQVSRVVSALEKRELLQRKTDENDQRSQRLLLTKTGETLVEKIIPKAFDWEMNLTKQIDENDYGKLFAIIEKLESQLNVIENRQ